MLAQCRAFTIEAYKKTYNKAEIDGFAIAIATAREGGHFKRVVILSAHINELRFYYLCAVPSGTSFLYVPFFPERKGQIYYYLFVSVYFND